MGSIFLTLATLLSHLSKVAARFELFFQGEGVWSGCWDFRNNDMNYGKGQCFERKELLKHNSFTFKVSVEIIALYDENGKEFEPQTEHKTVDIVDNDNNMMNARINSLETRIDEIWK